MSWKLAVRWIKRLGVPVPSVVLLALLATTGSAGAPLTHTTHTIGGQGQWTPISEVKHPDGRVDDSWRGSDGSVVSVSGLPGLHVTVLPEVVSRGAGQEVDHAVGLAVQGGMSKAPFANGTASGGQSIQLTNSVYTSVCVSYTSPDGHMYYYGCDTQYLDAANGNDWYMTDKQQVSARSDCASNYFCDHLRNLHNQVNYASGNTVIQFTPSATNPVGSCTTVGLSLQSQASSITYSESKEICPSSFGPYTLTSTNFGAIWKGLAPDVNGFWESSEAEDEVHNPPNVSPYRSYIVGMGWCSWCL